MSEIVIILLVCLLAAVAWAWVRGSQLKNAKTILAQTQADLAATRQALDYARRRNEIEANNNKLDSAAVDEQLQDDYRD